MNLRAAELLRAELAGEQEDENRKGMIIAGVGILFLLVWPYIVGAHKRRWG